MRRFAALSVTAMGLRVFYWCTLSWVRRHRSEGKLQYDITLLPLCHAEHSEASLLPFGETLRCAQRDGYGAACVLCAHFVLVRDGYGSEGKLPYDITLFPLCHAERSEASLLTFGKPLRYAQRDGYGAACVLCAHFVLVRDGYGSEGKLQYDITLLPLGHAERSEASLLPLEARHSAACRDLLLLGHAERSEASLLPFGETLHCAQRDGYGAACVLLVYVVLLGMAIEAMVSCNKTSPSSRSVMLSVAKHLCSLLRHATPLRAVTSSCFVMLSAAKHLCSRLVRRFTALSVTAMGLRVFYWCTLSWVRGHGSEGKQPYDITLLPLRHAERSEASLLPLKARHSAACRDLLLLGHAERSEASLLPLKARTSLRSVQRQS